MKNRQCPVCKELITHTVCPGCGYDLSCAYEQFPTLGLLGSDALPALSALQASREEEQKKAQLYQSLMQKGAAFLQLGQHFMGSLGMPQTEELAKEAKEVSQSLMELLTDLDMLVNGNAPDPSFRFEWNSTGMTVCAYLGKDSELLIPATAMNRPVTRIGESVFRYCNSLSSVVVPEGVTSIGGDAFCGCTGLKALTLPLSVAEIESSAFWWCSNLKDVYYAGTQSQWEKIELGRWNNALTDASIHFGA